MFAQVPGVWSSGYIPRGTRFGPLVGQVYACNEVPEDASRKYFWRIYTKLLNNSSTASTTNLTNNKIDTIINDNKSSTVTNVQINAVPQSPETLSPKPTSSSSSATISSTDQCENVIDIGKTIKQSEEPNGSIDEEKKLTENVSTDQSENDKLTECETISTEDYYYIDGADPNLSNWMRYVNPAYSSVTQNLVACQVEQGIYFYTIKSIPPEEELLVWYCKEFAERLNYPLTGEQMMLQIRKHY